MSLVERLPKFFCLVVVLIITADPSVAYSKDPMPWSQDRHLAFDPADSLLSFNQNGLIAYVGPDANGQPQIFTIRPDGCHRRQLTETPGGNFYPAWSRDGKRIAFASGRTGTPELWVMEADGSNQTPLTAPPASGNFVPSWSPDGTHIAFASVRTGHPEIWLINVANRGQRQLTETATPGGSNAPSWSPDGSKIAFASDRSGRTQVYTMNPDGSDVRQLTVPVGPNFPDSNVPVWSPDGSQIAFWSGIEMQYGQVWVMDADGSNRRVLTDCPPPFNCDNPAWSPDGALILFETNRGGPVETWIMGADGGEPRRLFPFPYGAGRLPWQPMGEPPVPLPGGLIAYSDRDAQEQPQLFAMEPDGCHRKQLTGSPGGNFLPAWSPDGGRLAFVSGRTGSPEIWVMDADGSHQKPITFGGGNFIPAWSPDSQRLAFTSVRTGRPHIWVMNADGSNPIQLTTEGYNNVPTWSPDGRKIAFWSGDEQGFGQIWVMEADGRNKTQLTFPLYTPYTPDGSSANAPAWSPDGSTIAFWSGIEHRYGQIWVMEADGRNRRQLTTEPAPISSDNPAWSPDGTKILFDTSRTGRPEIWVMEADGRDQRSLIREVRVIPARTTWQRVKE